MFYEHIFFKTRSVPRLRGVVALCCNRPPCPDGRFPRCIDSVALTFDDLGPAQGRATGEWRLEWTCSRCSECLTHVHAGGSMFCCAWTSYAGPLTCRAGWLSGCLSKKTKTSRAHLHTSHHQRLSRNHSNQRSRACTSSSRSNSHLPRPGHEGPQPPRAHTPAGANPQCRRAAGRSLGQQDRVVRRAGLAVLASRFRVRPGVGRRGTLVDDVCRMRVSGVPLRLLGVRAFDSPRRRLVLAAPPRSGSGRQSRRKVSIDGNTFHKRRRLAMTSTRQSPSGTLAAHLREGKRISDPPRHRTYGHTSTWAEWQSRRQDTEMLRLDHRHTTSRQREQCVFWLCGSLSFSNF